MSEGARVADQRPVDGTPATAAIPRAIGPGARFDGLLSFEGRTRVDGDLAGEVVARGTLVVGPEGRVRARIEVDELVVEGWVEGEVRAHRVELRETARLRGGLTAQELAASDGCLLHGRLRVGASPSGAGPAGGTPSEGG